MISTIKLDKTCRCRWWLLAASVAGLLLAPAGNAEQAAAGAPAPQAAPNTYGGPGAAPPPPGPYGAPPALLQPRFRPDPDLDGAAPALPAGMPTDFSNRAGGGSLTRQQFNEQQEAHRRQMDQYYRERVADMNQRVEAMQQRMDAMQRQSEAEHNRRRESMAPPAAEPAQEPDAMQQDWEQRKAEQAQRWEQQKAAQKQRMQQMQAEHEQRRQSMNAQHDQRVQAWPQYRPTTGSPAETGDTASAQTQSAPRPAPAQTQTAPQPAPPAYGYPPRGYGYGYPPPAYGYGPPGAFYPPYPAPAVGWQPWSW